MSKRLGLRAAATELGISHVALKKAADTGRVTRGEDRLFDVEQCRAQLAANSHPGKARAGRTQQETKSRAGRSQQAEPASRPAAEAPPRELDDDGIPKQLESLDYNELLCAKERVNIEGKRLELAVRQGALVEKDAVNAWIAGMILRAREILAQVGPELRDKLSKLTDPAEIDRLLTAEIDRALKELALYR